MPAGARRGRGAGAGAATSSDVIAAILTHPSDVDNATIETYSCVVNEPPQRRTRLAAPANRSGRTTPMTVTTWRTDPAHADIQFSAKHMMVTTVRGKFAEVDGSLDPRRGRSDRVVSGSFTVQAAVAHTGYRRSATATFARPTSSTPGRYPEITFVSTASSRSRQRLRGHGRPHDPRRDPPDHLRRGVPRQHDGSRAGAPASTPRRSSTARTGA